MTAFAAITTPTPVARLRLRQLLRLSWRGLWYDRWLALCTACVVAATLAPLWTEWGLVRGVIGTMIDRLERDPLMRQVVPEATGTSHFDAAWFARVKAWPEVVFITPTVRASSALVEMSGPASERSRFIALQATGNADPLLAGVAPPQGREIVLGVDAARQLNVAAGDPLRLALSRREGRETLAVDVKVSQVLPVGTSTDDSGLAPLDLLMAIEDWRDGYTVESLGSIGSGPPSSRQVFPLFRLHTASIRDVDTVASRLASENVWTRTRAADIESTLGLQRNLSAVMALIAVVAVTGAVLALVALQIAAVRRKRREYALLKLTGHGRGWLVALPCADALVVALLGSAAAWLIYAMGAAAINAHFAQHFNVGEAAVRLDAVDVVIGVFGAVVVSMLPALWAGWRASTVEAADELRES